MMQSTLTPVPYFQYLPQAESYEFAKQTYKPVPNKKIHRHCPFIFIDVTLIDQPMMDVAIAVADDVLVDAETAETDSSHTNGNSHHSADSQGDHENRNSTSSHSSGVEIDSTSNDIEQSEAALREKERLDYLARQPADPRNNDSHSFKTLNTAEETPYETFNQDLAVNPDEIPEVRSPSHPTEKLSSETSPKLADSIASPQTNKTSVKTKDSNSSLSNDDDSFNKKQHNLDPNKQELSSGDDLASKLPAETDTRDDSKSEKHSKKEKSKDKDEELTEEEISKREKEAKLEAYKQFVAEQKNQVEVDYQGIRVSIEANALPSRMYFIMNALSAIIASYGLVINSAAVVIGAMLVAMMLGPISGVALALIDYRMPLLRKSLLTVLAGGGTVVLIGFIVGFIHQDTPLTNEILSRTQPTTMDLMIALAGGTAGAYAMISPHLSVAVVGVAVATALVPPLAASGILFAHGQGVLGLGALLLAITNIIAIQFTNALVLWFSGFRRLMDDDYKTNTFVAFFKRNVVPLALLAFIGVYLTYNFNTITKKQKFETSVKETINDYFIDQGSALTVTQFLNREEYQTIRAVIRGETRPTPADAQYLEQVVNKEILKEYPKHLPVRIQLRYLPVVVIESSPDHIDNIDKTDAAILSNEQ